MGNRGILHDQEQRVQRRYVGKRWIICLLAFKGRKRQVMQPHAYTELFFLDEATALAAGHRPCAECQPARFRAFRSYWAKANPDRTRSSTPSANQLDTVLHAERLTNKREQATWHAPLATLPDGVIVELVETGLPHLIWQGTLLPWHTKGYGSPVDAPPDAEVEVLTPQSVVRAIVAGYAPIVHASANSSR